MDNLRLRMASPADAPDILAIYAPYIATPTTFEYQTPSPEAFAARVAGILAFYPYVVLEKEGQLIGYGYAARYRERAAYQWSAELSVYIRQDHLGHGHGGKLYAALIALTTAMGMRTLYATVVLPNPGSLRMQERFGFRLSGIQEKTGYKCGAWRDTALFEKHVGDFTSPPQPPISWQDLKEEDIRAALTLPLVSDPKPSMTP